MPAPKGTGTSPIEIGIIVVAVGGVAYLLIRQSNGTSSTTTAVSFAQPDPGSVAALASATAQESENQTQYLTGVAQSGAALAAQLASDQASIRTASINGATQEYDTYVQAGSAQNVATIQATMQQQLAAIAAGEQETINQQTATADENLGADTQNTQTTIANTEAGVATSGQAWGAISSVLSAGISAFTGGISGLSKLFGGSGSSGSGGTPASAPYTGYGALGLPNYAADQG